MKQQKIAFALMVAFFALAPLVLYPVFLMKVMCFALFACAFNLLIGFGGLLSFGHAMFLGTAGYGAAHAAKMAHGGGAEGPIFRDGRSVDHAANGFNPTDILRDFDYGKTTRLSSGRVLREWELVAADKEIEVAPGLIYPAWTYNGRIPGPTLRAREGERMRITFVNGSSHPHTIHFHGIHSAFMDGMPVRDKILDRLPATLLSPLSRNPPRTLPNRQRRRTR